MSSFLYRLARSCFRNRVRVVLAWLAVLGVLGVGALAAPKEFDDNFTIPGAASMIALAQLSVTFPEAADASAQLILTAPLGQRMDDPAVIEPVKAFFEMVERLPYVKGITSPYLEQASGQISDDGKYALASVRIFESVSTFSDVDRADLVAQVNKISDYLPGAKANIGGNVYSIHMPELTWVEALGLVAAIIVLIITLGSLLGGAIPVVTALTGVGCGVSVVVITANVTPVSATTLMLAVMLGLAVGIDYCLFIASRHRDQLATGMDVEESAARAVGTAGSAVVFAGLTVIIALVGLSLINLPFLTIMGVLAALTVAFMVCLAVTFLPALLGFLGARMCPKRPKVTKKSWEPSKKWVKLITKWPLVPCLVVLVGLGALTWPTTHLQLALPNSGQSEPGELDRITFDMVSEHFGVGFNGPIIVTANIVESDDPIAVVDSLKADIEAMPGVRLVSMATPNANADTALIQIIPTTGPDDPQTTALAQAISAKVPQWKQRLGVETAVTGFTVATIDVTTRLQSSMLPFALFVVGLSFLLLMMVFRSIWVPLKAALGYLLSVGGAFGATALVFSDGHLAWLINLAETRPVISFLPVFGMGILFGLAMDYEVFLTSRMREEYVHKNPNYVVDGFTHSAKVVISAAIIMFSVFVFFVPASGGMVKPIAFCLAVGVGLDAFLVRMTLGPAVMKLLGDRAWWLPKWLDRILPTLDIEGESLAAQVRIQNSFAGSKLVAARGLRAEVSGQVFFADLELNVAEGELLLIEGSSQARKALFFGLSGHVGFSSGEACIAGAVLPHEAAVVRRRCLLLDSTSDFGKVFPPKAAVVLIDEAEKLKSKQRQQLRDAMRESLAAWIIGVAPGTDTKKLFSGEYKVLQLEQRLDMAQVGGRSE
ncbi:MAG: MMPL family transporter [Propionibacteriaceae bacterium]|nr:MMPL family transporter [Propionibacteriaceae bacterium]